MSFIVSNFFLSKLGVLVGLVPMVPVAPFVKSLKPYTFLWWISDVNKDSDENINRFESLLDENLPTQKTYSKIKKWEAEKTVKKSCEIKFYLPGSKDTFFILNREMFKNENAWPIFSPDSSLGMKSKFERFAEVMDSKDPKYSLYTFWIENQCKTGKMELHWTEKMTSGISKSFTGVENVWLDKQLFS